MSFKTFFCVRGSFIVVMMAAAILTYDSATLANGPPTPFDMAYDFKLINQEGKLVRVSDFRGKVVITSYIFTRCPMPNMCPLATSKMAQLQARVNETPLKDRVVFMSISFDPVYDTPEVLKEYGKLYGADFFNWHFLTGDETEIEKAAQDVNVIYQDMGNGNFSHNMKTVVIGPDGTIHRWFRGTGWKVNELLSAIQTVVNQP